MKTILVAVDFSDVTDAVIEVAYTQAITSKASIRIVHASAPEPDFVGYGVGPMHEVAFREKALSVEKERLTTIANGLKDQGVDAVAELIDGPTVDVLLKEIKDHKVDLVIVGSHGHGALFNLVVGSVTQGLLKKSGIPVLVVPSKRR